MDIGPDQLDMAFPKEPFQHKYSREFLDCIKNGNLKLAQLYYARNDKVIYDFDSTLQTSLHWAVKRNFPEIVDFLIKSKCNVNAIDVVGRSPLFIASKYGYIKIVKKLLAAKAKPAFKFQKGASPLDVAKTKKI